MNQLRTARQSRGWTQARAAARLGVSQPYLAMLETGQRPLTPAVARRAMRIYSLAPTVLPPTRVAPRVGAATLAQDLAALGYPGFAHLARRPGVAKHPGAVLLTALAQPELEARVVEALPWLLLRYWNLDPAWLVREAKVRDLQNRLGFVVSLAREVAEREGDGSRLGALRALEAALDRSRLAREDTLGPRHAHGGRATVARHAPVGRRAPLESPDRLDGGGAAPSRLSRRPRGASSWRRSTPPAGGRGATVLGDSSSRCATASRARRPTSTISR